MRYLIGIDLGTTNSCIAYVDMQDPRSVIQSFRIPQLVGEGWVDSLSTLPSFCYLSSFQEWSEASIKLPWTPLSGTNPASFFVGRFAQIHGAKVPTRLVQSAKSWLSHPGVNRRDKILPLDSGEEESRISPVQASTYYLSHIRSAWNKIIAKGDLESEFEHQEIVLTVPASFDEVARSLTVEAARLAGFVHLTLLEEPQAAFYSWIAQHESSLQTTLPSGTSVLVCDVGGGTTDFSLIEVSFQGNCQSFQRMSVGDHLLLGGDNMDAAVAHYIETQLNAKGFDLTSTQRSQLLHEARSAKEYLLSSNDENVPYRVILQGSGSNVVLGTMTYEISRKEVNDLLIEGFFGQYPWSEAIRLRKNAGLRTMGLPYENETSITKQLAHFLSVSKSADNSIAKPDYVLFNGGVMKSTVFQEAILNSLSRWFPEKPVTLLSSYSFDQAVARGAAYFGKTRRGLGIKIGGGIARSYYLVLDTKDSEGRIERKALTLLERGSEEGSLYEPSNLFFLTPNTPVTFQLCTSHVRLHDDQGSLIPIDQDEMHFLPPIHTILRFGKNQKNELDQEKIPVHLQVSLTTIGTLSLNVKALKTEHLWSLEFQVRSASGQDHHQITKQKAVTEQTFDVNYLKAAEATVHQAFIGSLKPQCLMESLEESIKIKRREWPLNIMRSLADIVLKVADSRRKSIAHEERWWNIIGFLMRPGFGYPLDEYRIKELWKVILSDFKSPILTQEVQIQMWICWRRIAGGLTKGQQIQISTDLMGSVLTKKGDLIDLKNKSEQYPHLEKIRALGAMERIENSLKIRFGNALLARILKKKAFPADFWALGRIGARYLIYGTLVNVVPVNTCQQWVDLLLQSLLENDEQLAFLFGQLARKTEHREINLPLNVVEKILARFHGTSYHSRLQELLLQETHLTEAEQEKLFGDQLPSALLVNET